MDIVEATQITLKQLEDIAENNPQGNDIQAALGEAMVGGIKYQIQLCLIADTKLWVAQNEVRFTEVVKVHR